MTGFDKVSGMTGVIITIVVILAFTAAAVTVLRDTGDDLRGEPCSDAGGFWNVTGGAAGTGACQVDSGNSTAFAGFTHYSLSAIFHGRSGGAFLTIILAGVLFAVFAFLRLRD